MAAILFRNARVRTRIALGVFTRLATRWLILCASVIPLIASLSASAGNDYETTLINSISAIDSGNVSDAIAMLELLTEQYPNSKLARMMLGDLLAARAGAPALAEQFSEDQQQLPGLRDELAHRWQRQMKQTPATQGMLPANLLGSAAGEKYVLAADASQARLYVYENTGNDYQLVADYFMTIGKQGMGKILEGDLRTPEGVYYVTGYLPGEELPDRYGPGAFPINYPNPYDKMLRRTGYGIWIHGTESDNYNRVPLASDGCLSLSNDAFNDLSQYIAIDGSTPVIISRGFEWVRPVERSQLEAPARAVLEQWRTDRESLDSDRYLSHYSSSDFDDYEQFASNIRRITKAKTFVDIGISDLSIYRYPGDQEMILVSFNQHYRSSNYQSNNHKQQLWQRQDDKWQIIYEQ